MHLRWLAIPLILAAPAAPAAMAREGGAFVPRAVPFAPSHVARLQAAPGYRVSLFASGLGNPRNMAVAPDGTVYVTRRATGDVVAVRAGKPGFRVVARGLDQPNGITLRAGKLYVAPVDSVRVADVRPDGSLGSMKTLMGGFPPPGQHPNRTLAFGPDGKLYVTVGSTCNVCIEESPESATVLVADADGKHRRVFAKGLRNTIGFDWHPTTGALWGMDHGSDWRGDDAPGEELNELVAGGDYGWPFCLNGTRPDPEFGKQRGCAGTRAPALTYPAHSSPLALMFPKAWGGDAVVTFRGSWNRSKPAGYKVTRLRFAGGKPQRFEDFVTGFLSADGKTMIGRPAGVATAADGAILIADDTGGAIYRVGAVR